MGYRVLPALSSLPSPDRFPNPLESFRMREEFVKSFSWSIPSEDGLNAIKEFVQDAWILEICAGYGLWAAYLQQMGLTVIPTDLNVCDDTPLSTNPYCKTELATFTKIHQCEAAQAVQRYKTPCLFMSWPSYAEEYAANALDLFQGNKLIFIGEGSGGCTADDRFFDILDKHWIESVSPRIPHWPYIHDRLNFFIRT